WRVGRDGVPFRMWKFRTMVNDAETRLHVYRWANEREGPLFKLRQDPRVTRLGRLLRRSSVDELPQLFNVLLGNMSVVGPRPALPAEVGCFSAEFRDIRGQVKPGVTGLWQVRARDDPSFEAYEQLDAFYAYAWTIGMDLRILMRTPLAVLRSAWAQQSPEKAMPAFRHSGPPESTFVPVSGGGNRRTVNVSRRDGEPSKCP
ncbi:MAG: sugar transferase, partial [Actinobacteria bacterium]|nr:sugar transferase [Actinomycetota bacterium]